MLLTAMRVPSGESLAPSASTGASSCADITETESATAHNHPILKVVFPVRVPFLRNWRTYQLATTSHGHNSAVHKLCQNTPCGICLRFPRSHSVIVWTAAAFGRNPRNDLIRVMNVACFTV